MLYLRDISILRFAKSMPGEDAHLSRLEGNMWRDAPEETLGDSWGISEELREQIGGTSVRDLPGFSFRTWNCMTDAGINTLRELLSLTPKDLLHMPNFGQQRLEEVHIALSQLKGDRLLRYATLGNSCGISEGCREQIADMRVADLPGLTVRSAHYLRRAGILTVGQLLSQTDDDLLQLRNFGVTSLSNVKSALGRMADGGLHPPRKADVRYVTLGDSCGISEGCREHIADMRVADLPGLSVRSQHCLMRAGTFTVGQLLSQTGDDLLQLRNFGVASLSDVNSVLRRLADGSLGPSRKADTGSDETTHFPFEGNALLYDAPQQALGVSCGISEELREQIGGTSVRDLPGFSFRTWNCMTDAGINTLRELFPLTPKDLLHIPNFGQQRLEEVQIALSRLKSKGDGLLRYVTLGDSCGIGDQLLEQIGGTPIRALPGLSPRAKNCLTYAGIGNLRELLALTDEDLLQLWNFGTASLSSVRRVLQGLANGDLDPAVTEMDVPLKKRGLPVAPEAADRPVDELHLPTWVLDALRNEGIETIGQLSALTECDLIRATGDSDVLATLSASLARWQPPPKSIHELFERCSEALSSREKDIISRRWGIHGGDGETLEQVGQEYGLTRERIRQIEAKALKKLHRTRARRRGLEMVRQVVQIADSCTEIATSRSDLLRHLQMAGFEVADEELKMVQFFIDIGWVDVPAGVRIDMYSTFPVLRGEQRFAEVIRLALKHARNRGGAYLRAIAEELGVPADECREILLAVPIAEVSPGWFILPQAERPFLSHVRLIHAYCGDRLTLRLIRSGLRRQASRDAYYRSMPLPPSEVIGAALATLPEFCIDSESINWKCPEGLGDEIELSGSIQVLVSLFDTKGPILSYPEIYQGLLAAGFSGPTVTRALAQSPLVRKLEAGLYMRAGADISWSQMQEARTRRAPDVSADSSLRYIRDGSILLEINVGGFGVSGVIQTAHLDRLHGRWSLTAEGKRKGSLTVRNNYAYGLASAFAALGVGRADRIRLSFDVRERVVDIALVTRNGTEA